MGPITSWLYGAIGMIPSDDIHPKDGFKPTRQAESLGATIEPSVSVPSATTQRFAATATAEPLLEP